MRLPGDHDADEAAELEREALALLSQAGLTPRDLSLEASEQVRMDRDASLTLNELLSGGPATRAGGAKTRRRWPRRWWIVAVPAAATIAAVGVIVGVQPPSPSTRAQVVTPPLLKYGHGAAGSPHDGGRSAVEPLKRLADRAASRHARTTTGVQRVVMVTWRAERGEATATANGRLVASATEVESYLLPDGVTRVITRSGVPLDTDGRVDPRDATSREVVSDRTSEGQVQAADYAATLSTDPERLTRELMPGTSGCAVVAYCFAVDIAKLHGSYVISPQLSAAMWRALAATEQVTALGKVTDRLKRSAVAFATPTDGKGRRLVVYADPATGAFLGSEELLVADGHAADAQAPAVLRFTFVVTAEKVAAKDVPGEPR